VGLLAKADMLRILTVFFSLFLLLFPGLARAGFFDEKETLVSRSSCSACKSDSLNMNPDIRGKVAAIEETISNNLNKKDTYDNQVILFIDLFSSSSDVAVETLLRFKRDNPSWKVKGVIVGDMNNLKSTLLKKREFFSNGIEFSVDLGGNLAREFAVSKTPAYVVSYNGRQVKFTGQVDLSAAISSLE
jgi:hypothetical protein